MENFDLNALRAAAERSPELSRDEKIAALQETIARLKAEQGAPSLLEEFDSLTPEEQATKIETMNAGLPEEERYTPESFREELLAAQNGPDLASIRLHVAEAELKELLDR